MALAARRLGFLLQTLLAGGLAIGTACAQSVEPRRDRPPPLELGVGGQAGMAFGRACVRVESDVIGCEDPHALAGVQLTPRWRFSSAWSVGALGSLSWGSGVSGVASLEQHHWWQLGAQLRWHPLAPGHPALWIGPDLGLVALADRVAADGAMAARSYTTAAPALGASLGTNLQLSHATAIGIDLRGFVGLFGNGGAGPVTRPSYATQAGVLLSVSMNLLLGS
jgi:hypothetical protein